MRQMHQHQQHQHYHNPNVPQQAYAAQPLQYTTYPMQQIVVQNPTISQRPTPLQRPMSVPMHSPRPMPVQHTSAVKRQSSVPTSLQSPKIVDFASFVKYTVFLDGEGPPKSLQETKIQREKDIFLILFVFGIIFIMIGIILRSYFVDTQCVREVNDNEDGYSYTESCTGWAAVGIALIILGCCCGCGAGTAWSCASSKQRKHLRVKRYRDGLILDVNQKCIKKVVFTAHYGDDSCIQKISEPMIELSPNMQTICKFNQIQKINQHSYDRGVDGVHYYIEIHYLDRNENKYIWISNDLYDEMAWNVVFEELKSVMSTVDPTWSSKIRVTQTHR